MMKRKNKNSRKSAPKIISKRIMDCPFYEVKVKDAEKGYGSGKTVAKIGDSGKTIEVKDAKANGKAIENENVDIDNKANILKAELESRRKECALKFLEKFEERERLRLQQQDQSQCQGQGQNEGHGDQCQNLGPNQDQGQNEGHGDQCQNLGPNQDQGQNEGHGDQCQNLGPNQDQGQNEGHGDQCQNLGPNQDQGQNEGHGDQYQNLGPNQDQGEGEGKNTGEKRKAEDEAQNEKKKLKSDSDAIDGNEESDQKSDDDGDKDKDDQTPSGSGVSKADIHEKEQDREVITLEVNEPNSPSIISRIFPWTKPATYKYSQKVGDWTLSIRNLNGHGMISMKIFETPGGQLKIRIFGRYQNQKNSYENRQHHFQVEVLDGTTLNEISLKIPRAFSAETGVVDISQDGDFTQILATPYTCVKRM